MGFFDLLMQTQENGVLHTYPEYENITINTANWVPINGGTRNIYSFESDYGSIIAKKERMPDDKYRKNFNIPVESNMTLSEISCLRALSTLDDYEDEFCKISYETPVGYYQDSKGVYGLFKQVPYEHEDLSPKQVVNTTNNILNDAWKDQITDLMAEIKTTKSISNKIESYVCLTWNLLGRPPKINQASLDDIFGKYDQQIQQAREILGPAFFSEIIALYNGVYDRDRPITDYISYFNDGKTHLTSLDFEFSVKVSPQILEQKIDSALYLMAGLYPKIPYSWDGFDNLSVVERRNYALDVLSKPLKKRIDDYLRPSGYFDGQIDIFGPAYDSVQTMPAILEII